MKIVTKDIHVYYICPDRFTEQAKIVQNTCKEVGFLNVNRISFNESGSQPNIVSRAHIFTCDKILEDNKFPALILEDDATLLKPLPEYLFLPEKFDMMYLGGSVYHPGTIPNLYAEEYDENNYRVYHMLSTHALLFNSIESILKYREICEFAINAYHDVELGRRSKDNVYITPKDGMYFYQSGYTQGVTKFEWKSSSQFIKK